MSFDIFGVLVIIFNFGNLAISLGKGILKMYEDYQL